MVQWNVDRVTAFPEISSSKLFAWATNSFIQSQLCFLLESTSFWCNRVCLGSCEFGDALGDSELIWKLSNNSDSLLGHQSPIGWWCDLPTSRRSVCGRKGRLCTLFIPTVRVWRLRSRLGKSDNNHFDKIVRPGTRRYSTTDCSRFSGVLRRSWCQHDTVSNRYVIFINKCFISITINWMFSTKPIVLHQWHGQFNSQLRRVDT